MLISILLVSGIIPILYSLGTDWIMPSLLMIYCFFAIFGSLLALIGQAGADEFNNYRQDGRNYKNENYNESNTNPYYSFTSQEKRKNGGFTDKEVIDKKKLIRKKLEIKKLIKEKNENKERVC